MEVSIWKKVLGGIWGLVMDLSSIPLPCRKYVYYLMVGNGRERERERAALSLPLF